MVNAFNGLYYAAAASTAIAGMIHLMLGPGNLGFNINQGILFIVGGITQVFWIVPMFRRWGTIWYAIGIAGTAAFAALFFITRVPGNPITGRGGMMNPLSITLEIFQLIFIGLAAAIMVYEIREKHVVEENAKPTKKRGSRQTAALAAIAAVIVLIGLFVLPLANSGQAGPPRQGSGSPSGQAGPQPASGEQPGIISANQTQKNDTSR